MNTQRQKQPVPWALLFLFFVILVSVLVSGICYYEFQKKNLLSEKQLELSVISDLKVRQINQWQIERISDGKIIEENVFLTRNISGFIQDTSNRQLRNDIIQSLKPLIDNINYKNILLLDISGNVMFAFPDQDTLIGDHLRPLLDDIVLNRRVVLTDLHRANEVSPVHLDLIIPLVENSKMHSQLNALLVIRVDPHKFLYPLVQAWPTPSKSAETLILRMDGDEIIFLNELRHLKNTELILRKPVSSDNLPAAMAVKGIIGTVNGLDYRNVPVVAVMKKIPGVHWYMVAKVDREEVFSVVNKQMKMVIIMLTFFILSIGLFLGFLLWNQRVKFYRGKYEAEFNRLALVKHFDYILKFANDVILLINSEMSIVEANDHALVSYMYSRDELIGMKLGKLQAPETLSQMSEQISNVNENGSATFETYHKRKDTTVFPIEISSRIVDIEGAKYYQMIGRNITDRKHAEVSLKESEEKFRKIFEESPFCIAIAGKDFGLLRANLSFCKMTGYQEEEILSFTFKDLTHPDHVEENEVSLLKLIAGEIQVYNTEKRYICKNGSIVWGSTTVSIIHSDTGEAQVFLVIVEDITARKQAKVALEKSFSLINATIESTADGLIVIDTYGKIVQFNQKFVEMWRIPQEILDSGEDNVVLDYVKNQLINPETFLEDIQAIYSEPESSTSDLLEFNDGRFFDRYSQPQKINGKSVGRVWSFRDITAKKKAESDLIAAKEKAEESDMLKTAFLHNVSHEIRTPMNAIIGFSTLLGEPDLMEPERCQYLDIISQSSNQLLAIINDIVDIANVESGQVKMNLKEMDLNSALRSLSEQFSNKGEYKIPVNLENRLADEQLNIITDSTKLIQVLSNLIGNAIKFTREGSINFGYVINGRFLEFFVRDTGIGIPSDQLDKIFNRFYQVDSADSRQFGGTGLGLSICKAYVELLGGTITVESEFNKGTVFTFAITYRET